MNDYRTIVDDMYRLSLRLNSIVAELQEKKRIMLSKGYSKAA